MPTEGVTEKPGPGTGRVLAAHSIIPVASGKGGVGKSTVSANLAVALAREGARVGLMDADVYGPSIPMLMGVSGAPTQHDGKIVPHIRYGVKIISMGFFLPKGEAVIWRGPMLHKTVDQFLGSVDWGELDYLVVDLPPGTGDIQLSLCQKIPLTGAVIVSTPQDLAFQVAEKAIAMFEKLRTPILGIVENMSGYICSHCGNREEIFGSGGARRYAEEHHIPFLGEIPLSTDIRSLSDQGNPVVMDKPDSPGARAFFSIMGRLKEEIERRASGKDESRPTPREVSQPSKTEVRIAWADGHESLYSAYALRMACSCALCVDENTGRKLIREGMIKKDVYAVTMERVGRYAISFRWSDGHASGIYTFDHLRKICPCEKCVQQ